MGFSWFSVLLLATVFVLGTSDYNEEICEMPRTSCGLVPPPLPKNFEMKFEQVDQVTKNLVYSEIYFDYVNTLGKYMYVSQGIEYHSLFDYQTRQIVTWRVIHPGVDIKEDPLSHKCETISIDDSPDRFIFGYMDEFTNRPKMYNSNEMLRFGGRYVYQSNGTDSMKLPDRNLMVDLFTGCVYDSTMDITMAMDYYFTSEFMITSSGSLLKPVTGKKYALLPVPAKIDMFSESWADENKTIKNVLNRTENVFWFKGEPEFQLHTFKIPPYMNCKDYQGRKEMLPFDTTFTTRMQKTKLVRDVWSKLAAQEISSYEEIFYYKDQRLARRDFTPNPDLDTEIINKFKSRDPVKTVYDFTEGVLYVTHVPTGRCYARKIHFGDFYETSDNIMHIKMGTPAEIFHMPTEDMEYKGTDFVRNIECDVYAGRFYDKKYKKYLVAETYVSTSGWHEEANRNMEYGVPVKHVIMTENIETELVEQISSYDFLKFIREPPPLIDFDIGNCIETQTHKDFAIFLQVDKDVKKILFDYKDLLVDTAQYYITNVSQVATVLRVQNVKLTELSISDKRPFLHFTLADKTKLKTDVPFSQKGFSLPEAERALHNYIDAGNFTISFKTPATKDFIAVTVPAGGLYEKTAGGTLEAVSYDPDPVFFDVDVVNEDEVEVRKGMSPGGLAGLSIAMLFIGIGIGIAIMYLYIRKTSESSVDASINMTHR